jgi:hypothetical protein
MRRMTVGVVVAAMALLFAAGALAATFKGKASSDAQTKISFKVSGNTKDGKFINGKVSQIYVSNQKFTCYTKSGGAVYSGRISYLYNGSAPVKIKPNGSFRSEYKIVGSSHVLQDNVFAGRITRNKKGKFVASGTYQAKVSEGGIEFGFCGDKNPVKWEARKGG